MEHKYRVGQDVYHSPPVRHAAPRGPYKITARLPVEIEGQHTYRIKNAAESCERTADESDLTLAQSIR